MAKLKNIISNLGVNKASGPNSIPTSLLKEFSPLLIDPIMNLINKSLTEGAFPSLFQIAQICPIYKKSDIPKILEFIKLDKKNKKSKITFSLPDKIGNIKKRNKKFTVEITDKKIEQTLKEYLNEI